MLKFLRLTVILSFLFLMGQQKCQTTSSPRNSNNKSVSGSGSGFLGSGRRSGKGFDIPGDQGPEGSVHCGKPQNTFQCLMCNCHKEAGNQDHIGKVMVNKVVMTRVGMPSFPNRVCSVVYQPAQFSWTNQRRTRNTTVKGAAYRGCYAAVKEAFQFRGHFASHYHTPAVWPAWRDDRNPTKFRHGYHIFYRRLKTERPEIEAPSGFEYRSTVQLLLNGERSEYVCKKM